MKEERVGNIAQWNKIRQIDERGEGSVGQPYKEAENRPQGVTRSRGEKETRGGEQRAEVGRHSLRDDVGTILDEYDTEGVKYPSIKDLLLATTTYYYLPILTQRTVTISIKQDPNQPIRHRQSDIEQQIMADNSSACCTFTLFFLGVIIFLCYLCTDIVGCRGLTPKA